MRVAVALLATTVLAHGITPAAAEPPVPYVEAPRWTDDPIRVAVDEQLAKLRTASRASPEREWVEQLTAAYRRRDFRPVWVHISGKVPVASTVVAELQRADDYALDPARFEMPAVSALSGDARQRGAADVQMSMAVLRYIGHARGHRVDPSQLSKWLDQKPRPVETSMVLQVAESDDAAARLRRHHPQHPQFEKLRQAYLKQRGAPVAMPARPEPVPANGPRLALGDEHTDVVALRKRLDVPAKEADDVETYDKALADAVRAFQREAGLKVTGVVTNGLRAALNGGTSSASKRAQPNELKKLLVNLERWRWMPDNLGALHVWNNLPEFETRVVKGGRIIHQERIVIGKPETQTPVFSDKMEFVVFQPDWGVPNSIKISDLLPRLRSGDTSVLERRGMKVQTASGKLVSGSSLDWSRVDIRSVGIVQQPGSANPLGQLKFMFPNKHDVYMHDTPAKHLFNSSVRTFSHGCIRVRNPRALADLVMAEDKGWPATQVGALLGRGSKENNKVDLKRQIDVHNTYFTIVASEDGSLKSLPDVYGHDKRIAMALDGTAASVIARDDPAVRQEQAVKARHASANARRFADPEERAFRQAAPVQRVPVRQWSPFFGLGYN